MPMIMSLEGPRLSHWDLMRGNAYGATPRPLWRLGRKLRELIPGGKAAGMVPSQFDPAALAQGIRVEMEHTNDPRVAQEIAMDHLVEDPAYYTKLRAVHLDGILDPIKVYPLWALGGLIAGVWLAGTTRGQKLVRKTKRRK